MVDTWFADYVLEQLEPFGGLAARRIFGGQRLFKGGLMFALIADGYLFFKVDGSNRLDFERIKS
jgi:DNA transformation protein